MHTDDQEFNWDHRWRALVSPPYARDPVVNWLKDLPLRMEEAKTLTISNDQALKLMTIPDGNDEISTVIKFFPRRQGIRAQWDKRIGSRSFRSWAAARHLQQSGIGTPEPIAILEETEDGVPVRDWLITRELPPHESFQERLIHVFRNSYDNIELIDLLQNVADHVRLMHDAGLYHRDLGNQNIVLLDNPDADHPVQFLDLNRARIIAPMGNRERARDLSRIYLPSDFLRIFFEMYYGGRPPEEFLNLEAKFRSRFALHSKSRKWRHPIRERKRGKRITPMSYPNLKDIWIWDSRSHQAISSLKSKDRKRMISPSHGARVATSTLRHLPAVHQRYKQLCQDAFQNPVTMKHRVGCAITPTPERWNQERDHLHGLGLLPVLLRFYFHETPAQHEFLAQCAQTLHAEGYPISIALVQNREAVCAPDDWRAFCRRILNPIHDVVEWAEIGHATNRVKWGCWTAKDYEALADCVPMLKECYPTVKFCGPAGIDFEYHRVLGSLSALTKDVHFDGLSHHLYVDRRGAPENAQGGFTTWQKCALARAIASVHPKTADEFIVSEVNWPLLDTGVYSPVGSPYLFPGQVVTGPSVSEGAYADYMIRYFLQALCSGTVTRIYWWNLAAHGFGLIDDIDPHHWRPRPAYHALAQWVRQMTDATYVRHETSEDGQQQFHFDTPGEPFLIRYAHLSADESITIPRPNGSLHNLTRQALPNTETVDLGGSPIYQFPS